MQQRINRGSTVDPTLAARQLTAGISARICRVPEDVFVGLYFDESGPIGPGSPLQGQQLHELSYTVAISNLGRSIAFNFERPQGHKVPLHQQVHLTVTLPLPQPFIDALISERRRSLDFLQTGTWEEVYRSELRQVNSLITNHPRVKPREFFAANRAAQNWLLLGALLRHGIAFEEGVTALHGLWVEADFLINSLPEFPIPADVGGWLRKLYSQLPQPELLPMTGVPLATPSGREGRADRRESEGSESRFDSRRIDFYMETPGWERLSAPPGYKPNEREWAETFIAHIFSLEGTDEVLGVFDTSWTGKTAYFLAGPVQQIVSIAQDPDKSRIRDRSSWVREPLRHHNTDVTRSDWEPTFGRAIRAARALRSGSAGCA